MGRGGKRAGAGRPIGSGDRLPHRRKKIIDPYEEQKKAAEKLVADNLIDVVKALIDLALGVKKTRIGKDGLEEVYTSPPDRQAAMYLCDRIVGKPTESQKVDYTGGFEISFVKGDLGQQKKLPKKKETRAQIIEVPAKLLEQGEPDDASDLGDVQFTRLV